MVQLHIYNVLGDWKVITHGYFRRGCASYLHSPGQVQIKQPFIERVSVSNAVHGFHKIFASSRFVVQTRDDCILALCTIFQLISKMLSKKNRTEMKNKITICFLPKLGGQMTSFSFHHGWTLTKSAHSIEHKFRNNSVREVLKMWVRYLNILEHIRTLCESHFTKCRDTRMWICSRTTQQVFGGLQTRMQTQKGRLNMLKDNMAQECL